MKSTVGSGTGQFEALDDFRLNWQHSEQSQSQSQFEALEDFPPNPTPSTPSTPSTLLRKYNIK
jgi:hypothetical protein